VYCLPTFDQLTRGNRIWFWVCAFLWLVVTPSLIPFTNRDPMVADALLVLTGVAAVWWLTRSYPGKVSASVEPLQPISAADQWLR